MFTPDADRAAVVSQLVKSKAVFESLRKELLTQYVNSFSRVAAVLNDEEFDAFISYHALEGRLLTINAVLGLL